MFVFLSLFFYVTLFTIVPLWSMEKEKPSQYIAQWLASKLVDNKNNEDILPFIEDCVMELRAMEPKKYKILKHNIINEKIIKNPSEELKQIGGSLVVDSMKNYFKLNKNKVKRYKFFVETGCSLSILQISISICTLVIMLTGVLSSC